MTNFIDLKISSDIVYESESYEVSVTKRGGNSIVLVFASAGFGFGGGPVKEFKNSLFTLNDVNYDICWVIDRKIRWYNCADNDLLIMSLKNLIGLYRSSVAIGESMGGSAALYFNTHLNFSRVLSLGPQFSMLKPFINFNVQLGPPSLNDYIQTKNYGFKESLANSFLFFGADSWQDFIHANFFKEFGYNVNYILDAGHTVAHSLKAHNKLIEFLDLCLNLSIPNDIFLDELNERLVGIILNRPSVKIFDFTA